MSDAILVVGGTGTIGQTLVQSLRDHDLNYRVLVRQQANAAIRLKLPRPMMLPALMNCVFSTSPPAMKIAASFSTLSARLPNSVSCR